MPRVKLGVQFPPEQCTLEQLREAWRLADSEGFDSIWLWDHFFPLHGDPAGTSLDSWTLLPLLATETNRAAIGALVTCIAYREPDLLADMARVVDLISGGRLVLGLGAGWYEKDFLEYGFAIRSTSERMSDFEAALERIESRLQKLNPPPTGSMPIMIGGGGEKVMLRLVAKHARMWNATGTPEEYRHKNSVLDRWCASMGRPADEIERTVLIWPDQIHQFDQYLDAGAQHVIVQIAAPFDLTQAVSLLHSTNRS